MARGKPGSFRVAGQRAAPIAVLLLAGAAAPVHGTSPAPPVAIAVPASLSASGPHPGTASYAGQDLTLVTSDDGRPDKVGTRTSRTVLSPDAPERPGGADASVETDATPADPAAEGPTLANSRWAGFTPAVYAGGDSRPGAWIAGPIDRKERTGWITDTASGATARVTFLWRAGGHGSRIATLSREAAEALGLARGDVANVAIYLPR